MIDRRYFRHTRATRERLEFRWEDWEERYGGRLGSGNIREDELSPKLAAVLRLLPQSGFTAKK